MKQNNKDFTPPQASGKQLVGLARNPDLRRVVMFITLFVAFYYACLFFIGIVDKRGLLYSEFIDRYLNFMLWLGFLFCILPIGLHNCWGSKAT